MGIALPKSMVELVIGHREDEQMSWTNRQVKLFGELWGDEDYSDPHAEILIMKCCIEKRRGRKRVHVLLVLTPFF